MENPLKWVRDVGGLVWGLGCCFLVGGNRGNAIGWIARNPARE
jgi:hypothetical protein